MIWTFLPLMPSTATMLAREVDYDAHAQYRHPLQRTQAMT
jgi:hypothetical protein